MANSQAAADAANFAKRVPDLEISVRQVFGIDHDMMVPAFSDTRRARAGLGRGLSVRS